VQAGPLHSATFGRSARNLAAAHRSRVLDLATVAETHPLRPGLPLDPVGPVPDVDRADALLLAVRPGRPIAAWPVQATATETFHR
jgi:hypothetical protein